MWGGDNGLVGEGVTENRGVPLGVGVGVWESPYPPRGGGLALHPFEAVVSCEVPSPFPERVEGLHSASVASVQGWS